MRWAWSRPYTDDTARVKMRTHHSNRMIDLTSNAISLRQAASADWMFMVPSVRVGAPWEPKWIFKKGVARIERSEMRGDIAAHNGAPGFAPLNRATALAMHGDARLLRMLQLVTVADSTGLPREMARTFRRTPLDLSFSPTNSDQQGLHDHARDICPADRTYR